MRGDTRAARFICPLRRSVHSRVTQLSNRKRGAFTRPTDELNRDAHPISASDKTKGLGLCKPEAHPDSKPSQSADGRVTVWAIISVGLNGWWWRLSTVDVSCDLRRQGTPLAHAWERCVGSGHAVLALRADYQAQLGRCHDELGVKYVRFHAVLSDDLGTLVCERNTLLYSFFNADTIWDALLSAGVRPFVELSFMPSALAFRDRNGLSIPRQHHAAARRDRMDGLDPPARGACHRALRH